MLGVFLTEIELGNKATLMRKTECCVLRGALSCACPNCSCAQSSASECVILVFQKGLLSIQITLVKEFKKNPKLQAWGFMYKRQPLRCFLFSAEPIKIIYAILLTSHNIGLQTYSHAVLLLIASLQPARRLTQKSPRHVSHRMSAMFTLTC